MKSLLLISLSIALVVLSGCGKSAPVLDDSGTCSIVDSGACDE